MSGLSASHSLILMHQQHSSLSQHLSEARNEHVAINMTAIPDAPRRSINVRHQKEFLYYKKIWKLVLTLALLAMFPALTQVVQLKFTNESPFKTHMLFSYTGVVAYVVAIPTSLGFFAMAYYLETFANERSSRLYYMYMILRCVFSFSVILAPLSFVMVLLVPNNKYNGIGYLVISLLFVVIVSYAIIDYLKLCSKKNVSNVGGVVGDEKHLDILNMGI